MGNRWLKVLLIVAVAFALTLSVAVLGKSWTHAPEEIDILWVAFMWPGLVVTRYMESHLWLSPDSNIDPQVLWWWLTIAFNTLFYSGLLGLVFMFVTEAPQRATPSTRPSLKTIRIRLLLSAATALVLGIAAVLLHWRGTCWDGGTECPAYSPTKVLIAFLLAPPFYLLQPGFFEHAGTVSNFDPVIETFGWVVLWAYYFALLSIARPLIRRFRK